MKIIQTKSELRKYVKNKEIGLVPTMGSLHEGHISLVKKSLQQNRYTLVSIFVNPKQFGVGEDYTIYPRDLGRDQKILSSLKVDAVFFPKVKEIYPHHSNSHDSRTDIYLGCQELESLYCGKYRPGFYNGVLLVVIKLLHLVEPRRVYFGKKDYQQFFLVKKMVDELDLDLEVKGLPTVRDKRGLALSSRNQYLGEGGKEAAQNIWATLRKAKKWVMQGEVSSPTNLREKIIEEFKKENVFNIQYVEIVNKKNLLPAQRLKHAIILVAGHIERVRLIDNIEI